LVKIQRFKDSRIQRFKDSRIQRFKDSKISFAELPPVGSRIQNSKISFAELPAVGSKISFAELSRKRGGTGSPVDSKILMEWSFSLRRRCPKGG